MSGNSLLRSPCLAITMFTPKKYFKFVVFTAVALGLLAFASPADTASKKVLLVGDSLSVGYSPVLRSSDKSNSYTAQVYGGWQAKNLNGKFDGFLKCGGGEFHTVVIWAGINDIYSSVGTDNIVSSVKSMVSKAKSAGAGNVIVVNVSPSGGNSKSTDKIKQKTKDVNSKLGSVGASKVVDAYSILEDPKKPGYAANTGKDGLHLTGTGYGIIAKAVKSAVDILPAGTKSTPHPADACPVISAKDAGDSVTFGTPESVPTNFTSGFFGEVKDVCDYWKKIFDFAIKIAGGLAMLVIILGGVVWLASAGDSAKLTKAKDLIGGALTGLFIAMTAYVGFMVLNPYLLECKIEIPVLKMVTGGGSDSTPINVCDYLESYSSQSDCESKEAKCGSGTSCINGKYDDVLGLNDKWCCTAGFQTVGACPVPVPDIKKCDKELVPKHKWDGAIIAAANRQGLDSTYVKAIMLVETGLGKDYNVESVTGAYGIMQFQPSTASYIFRVWKPPSGKAVPAICTKEPLKFSGKYNPDTAKTYCGSYKRSTINTNCCTIKPGRSVCEKYPTVCKKWFDNNIEDAVDMGIYFLKRTLKSCGNHLSVAAGAYNSGAKNCTSSTTKPSWCHSGSIKYIYKAAKFQRKYCEESGGKTETPKMK